MPKEVRAGADPPTGIPRKAARLGAREGAGPRTGGKNQPRSWTRALVPGSLFSPSAYNCAWRPACAQYTGGRKRAVPSASLGDQGFPTPPPLSGLPPSSPSGNPERGRGRPSFHSCIWGQGRGPEAWTPYLLLQPGAMAPPLRIPRSAQPMPTPPAARRAGIPPAQDGREFEFGARVRR